MCFMPAGSMSRLMRAVLIYMRVNLSLWEVGRELERDLTVADSILRKVMSLLPLAVNCWREYVKLCLFANLNSITDTGGQTCSPFEIRQLPDWLSSALCHYCLHCLYNCCRGPGQSKDGCLSITVPPLSSVILIWKVCLAIDFPHLPKAWWTAAWSDSHITHPGRLADINNQPFPSSLFGITRPYIRPNSHLLAAKLLEAPNSFGPYKVIQSVVGQGKKEMGL